MNPSKDNLTGFSILRIFTQAELNAAILEAIKQTEDALKVEIIAAHHMANYHRKQANEYYYRWRSE